jgi:hypothetical protein
VKVTVDLTNADLEGPERSAALAPNVPRQRNDDASLLEQLRRDMAAEAKRVGLDSHFLHCGGAPAKDEIQVRG